jgi:light-regulated signal transduction histidine kinase (bacteriophytochrome)
MRTVAGITEFDRVMLYRFLPDWHGEVLAEALKPGVDGYLGLRFPGGNIPPPTPDACTWSTDNG